MKALRSELYDKVMADPVAREELRAALTTGQLFRRSLNGKAVEAPRIHLQTKDGVRIYSVHLVPTKEAA